MSRAAILALVADLLAQGVSRVSPAQIDRAVGLALVRYDQDRPRTVVEDVAGGGTTLPLPTAWVPGVSALRGIETPPDHLPPADLDADAWMLYQAPDSEQIRLAAALPAGQLARLAYTVPHVLTDGECTVPVGHHEAFACYAAAVLCEQIATSYADNAEATIAADRVDQTSPAREWSIRARSYRTRYFASLGIASSGGQEAARPQPAGTVAQMDLAPSWSRSARGRWMGRR